MSKLSAHLVVVGFDEIVANKYLPCIQEAISNGKIDSYSIIDLETQRAEIEQRVSSVELRPEHVYFLPDPRIKGLWADVRDFDPLFKELIKKKGAIKVYIATEVKAHEEYLRYCVENGIDSLVEKPVLAPMTNGSFDPSRINSVMHELIAKTQKHSASHSVMTLSRYHRIYNDLVLGSFQKKMIEYNAPLSSFHFRTAGGVWNMHKEYQSREDHPYKYGYGMLMHGAYHYIDLSVQFLLLNKNIFPKKEFTLTISSFAAYPADQNDRLSKKYSKYFDDDFPEWASANENLLKYGETDIVSVFSMQDKKSGRVLTVGTLSFEQTTPSVRSWKEIPDGIYNKNGRISHVDLEARISTLHSVNVQCFDVPIKGVREVERIDAFARVSERTNASLLINEDYNTEKTFTGLFHSDSNRQLMSMWLNGKEVRSRLSDHVPTMQVVQALACSIQRPGLPVVIDFI